MGCDVFANGMEIACKVSDGKTVAAMPDVCLSPPTPPAGPVPIPYPNTAMASDTTNGSKTVQIGGGEVMLKDQSTFKKSTGDEAATKSLGMGVVSHQIQGEVNFCAWSMDVKFEGQNVPRNLDLTLHNEMCIPANTPPWPFVASMTAGTGEDPCEQEKSNETAACGSKSEAEACADENCQNARQCKLVPYGGSGSPNCCDTHTGHHLIAVRTVKYVQGYNANAAPTVCAKGRSWHRNDPRFEPDEQTHPDMHDIQDAVEASFKEIVLANRTRDRAMTYGETRYAATQAHQHVFATGGCSEKCIGAQLDRYHKGDLKMNDSDLVNTSSRGRKLDTVTNAARDANNSVAQRIMYSIEEAATG
jgi:Domain of unknown function (DUF4150)